jgi:hypothetical protein
MQHKKGILLASFITTDDEEVIMNEVNHIVDTIDITNNYIFLLSDEENPQNKILTYNALIEKGKTFNSRLYTIRVHRKKQTNTLYTINALNQAVAAEHDGATGKHLKLDWEKYKDSILLTAGKELKVHPVRVLKIFKIEEEPQPEEGE